MVRSLQSEIKQTRAFRSTAEEAYLSIVRTADIIDRHFTATLKPYGLTATQYNVLRILRGAGADGLASGEVAERMITREPDITRLLDRMEERGLVRRIRDVNDRRVVRVWITGAGHELVDKLDVPIDAAHQHCLGRIGEEALAQLSDLLGSIRALEDPAT